MLLQLYSKILTSKPVAVSHISCVAIDLGLTKIDLALIKVTTGAVAPHRGKLCLVVLVGREIVVIEGSCCDVFFSLKVNEILYVGGLGVGGEEVKVGLWLGFIGFDTSHAHKLLFVIPFFLGLFLEFEVIKTCFFLGFLERDQIGLDFIRFLIYHNVVEKRKVSLLLLTLRRNHCRHWSIYCCRFL